MKTKTIGEVLQSQRLQHQLSIEELAQRTRIRKEYIEALEANNFPALPSATFVKGYIKTYAKLFGFEYEPLLALLRRDFRESATGTLVPREFIKPVLKKRVLWTPVTMTMMGLVVIFVTLLSYVGVQWYNIQKPPRLIVTVPEENAFVSSQIKVTGETINDAIVTINSQPVSLRPDGTFEGEVFLPREGIHTITIEALDRRGKKSVIQRPVHVRF